MTRIIGIVKDEKELDKIDRRLKDLGDGIVLNLSNKKINSTNVKTKSDYINETKLINELSDKIRNMSINWKMISFSEAKKLAKHDGIPLYECTSLHFELVLRSLIVNVELIKKVIEKEKPDMFLIVDGKDLLSKTIITSLKELNAKYEIISNGNVNLMNIFRKKTKFIAGRYIKPVVLDNYVKLKNFNYKNKNYGDKRVMFFSYLNLDPQIMLPIIEEMKKQGKNYLVFALALDVQEAFAKKGIKFNTFADYDLNEINNILDKKKKELDQIWEILQQDRRFMYDNINLWEILEDELYYTVFKHFYEVVRLIEGIKIVIKKEKIDVIVIGSDVHRFGKTVSFVGNKLEIKSLVLQHGVAGRLGFVPVTSTKIAVWGEATKKFLLQNNVNDKKIVITGASKFDIIKNKQYNKEEVYKQFNLDKDKKIILFGTQTVPEKEDMFKAVINSLQDEQLIIKLHPKDEVDFYNSRLKDIKNKVVVVKDYDIYNFLNIADLTISRASSTVVIESMLFNVPVITLNLANIKGSNEMIDYNDYGCVIDIKEENELKKAINEVFNNKKIKEKLEKNMEKFIKDYAYKIDGKSTERVINLIDEISIK